MKLYWNRKYTTIAVYAALVLFAASFVIFFLMNNNDFGGYFSKFFKAISPITYGIVIAYLLNPLVVFFDQKVFAFLDKKGKRRLRRGLSIAATMIIFLAFLAMLVSSLVPQLISSATDLQSKFSGYVTAIRAWLEKLALNSVYLSKALYYAIDYIETFLEKTGEIVNVVMPWLANMASSVLGVLKNAVIGMILSVFLLFTKEKFGARARKLCRAWLTEGRYERFIGTVKRADNSFGGYIKGTIVDAILVGIVTFFLMWILGVPYYPLIALVLAVTNIIPIFGPYIGSIPSGLIILIAEPSKVIPFTIMVLIVQGIDGNLVAPKLIGSRLGMPSEWVVIAITIMSGFFGVSGMLIGVPVFAVVYVMISEWADKRLAKRSVSFDSLDYCSDRGKVLLEEAEEKKPKNNLFAFLKKKKRGCGESEPDNVKNGEE